MSATLLITKVRDGTVLERYSFGPGPRRLIKIGSLAKLDIPLDDPEASRVHAVIQLEGGKAMLRELGTLQGVRLNGELVRAADRHLADGDHIVVGSTELYIELQQARPSPALSPAWAVSGAGAAIPAVAPRAAADSWSRPAPARGQLMCELASMTEATAIDLGQYLSSLRAGRRITAREVPAAARATPGTGRRTAASGGAPAGGMAMPHNGRRRASSPGVPAGGMATPHTGPRRAAPGAASGRDLARPSAGGDGAASYRPAGEEARPHGSGDRVVLLEVPAREGREARAPRKAACPAVAAREPRTRGAGISAASAPRAPEKYDTHLIVSRMRREERRGHGLVLAAAILLVVALLIPLLVGGGAETSSSVDSAPRPAAAEQAAS